MNNLHLFIDGCNTDLQVQRILIHADISFRQDLTPKQKAVKIEFLQDKIEQLLIDHFFDRVVGSEVMDNDEYNKMMATNSL